MEAARQHIVGEHQGAGRDLPGVPAAHLENYLRAVAHARGLRVAQRTARQIGLFARWLRQHGAAGLAELGWSDYLRALEWIGAEPDGFAPTTARALGFLDGLRGLYAYLCEAGCLADAWELLRARAVIASGRGIPRLGHTPYAGPESWTTLAAAGGRPVPLCVAELWLCHLWVDGGGSWEGLEERVAGAPGAAGKLSAVDRLRARLAEAGCVDPGALLPNPRTSDDRESALRWLREPADDAAGIAPDPGTPEPEMVALDTTTLVARLRGRSRRMPRREMAELLRRGEVVLGEVRALLEGRDWWREGGDPLWAIVVLGELRQRDAVPTLGRFLRSDEGGLGTAAAEALAKIGAASVPSLVTSVTRGELGRRLHGYAALGMIPTEASYRCLAEALGRERTLPDVVARAIAQHRRREAIPLLEAASAHVPDSLRREFDWAIYALVHRVRVPDTLPDDWRVRYRRLPGLDWNFPLSWIGVAAIAHRHGPPPGDLVSPPRARDAILADTRLDPGERRCRTCGGVLWFPAGLPVCRHTARAVVALQVSLMARWRNSGFEDVWDALDACDAADLQLGRRPDATGDAHDDALGAVAVGRATLYWMVSLGRLTLADGARALSVIACEIAALYGSPARAAP
jgi:hypothetical protein